MKHFIYISFLFCILTVIGFSNSKSDAVWKILTVKETQHYKFSVPSKWRELAIKGFGFEHFFIADGQGFPITYNNNPLIVRVFLNIMPYKTSSLEEAKNIFMAQHKQNPDRIFAKNFKHLASKIKLKSGQPAYILSSRFYNKSKQLYQSRFDLLAYSTVNKTGYLYTISIQHTDKAYQIDERLNINQFAVKLYSYFELKK